MARWSASGVPPRVRRLGGPTSMALAERLVNRGASAGVTFVMALFVVPEEAGAYAFGMLALTLSQAVGQGVLSQVGVAAWRYRTGGEQLTRISRATAVGGAALVLLAVLGGLLGSLYDARLALDLVPLAAVAFIVAWYLPAVTAAQYQGEWARLTRAQSVGSLLSLLVALPLLPVVGILGAVLQTLVAETWFAVAAGRQRRTPVPDRDEIDVLRRFVLPTVVTNLFGWATGQADRLVVTLLAGAGPLGLLSIALAVSKTVTDAVLAGTLNLLRFRLAAATGAAERMAAFSAMLLRSLAVAGALQVVVTVLSVWPLRPLLGPEWRPGLAVVPLLAMSGPLMATHYSISAAVIEEGGAARLRVVNVTSLVLGVGVGVLLARSLPLGAAAEALADLVGVLLVLPLARGLVDRRARTVFALVAVAAFLFGGTAYALQALIP